jgi:hypothetical protein
VDLTAEPEAGDADGDFVVVPRQSAVDVAVDALRQTIEDQMRRRAADPGNFNYTVMVFQIRQTGKGLLEVGAP